MKLGSKVNKENLAQSDGTGDEEYSEYDGPNTTPIPASYIKSKILRKKEIKRTMFQCPLILKEENNFIVSVRGYAIVTQEKPATRYKLVYEHENIRKEASSRRKFLNPNTGEEIKPDELCKVFPYGDQDIELNDKEVAKINDDYSKHESFLKVIGFRSTKNSIRYFNNIDKALFVVPDESQYEGTIKTMASLFRVLKKRDKCMIVWGKVKSNSNLRLYILSPTTNIDRNEGFYLYRIPFLDEIRKFPKLLDYNHITTSEDYLNLVRITENIIGYFNLKKGYRPSDFKNPSLQRHYKTLHDYLLQVEQPVREDGDSDGQTSRFLKEDDTLNKILHIREKIIASKESDDVTQQRLSKYVSLWNTFYIKMEKESGIDIDTSHKLKKGKFELNL